MKKITFLTIYLSLFLVCGLFSQQTVYVSATGAGLNDGTSEANARGSFGDAMNDINSEGDKLIIIGTVSTSGANLTSKSFAFTIEGLDASSTLTANGGTGRLFTINGATTADVTLKDLTFSGINTTLAGGGVLFSNNAGATVTFNNCNLTGNSVTNIQGGGAIFFANGTLNIIDSSFENNTSSTKGGAIFANSGTITITNTLFKTNSAATKGGAIYTVNADFTITGSTFYDNETTGAGGGSAFYVEGSGSSNSITNCTFFQNTTANTNLDYGTIRTDNGNTTVTNSLFYNNKTNNDTGGTSDWGSGPNGTQTFNTSIAQWISTNVDNQDEGTGSITGIKNGGGTAADLINSGLAWNATTKRVEYTAPSAVADHSPIDFASNSDVGAWDSEINIFIGGTTGAVEGWTTAANWSNGVLPSATDNVAILTGRNCNLPISTTVNDIKVTSLLRISSNQGLVVNGDAIVTGTVRYSRALTNNADNTKAWHLVASPVVDEVFDTSYLTINDIAVGTNSNRGIATYNTGDNSWSYYTGVDITATSGQGYSMKITPDEIESAGGEYADGIVVFEGTLNDTDFTTPALAAGFNLLGNPYTSFVNSGVFLTDAANSAAGIDKTQMWVWNSSTENYDVKTVGEAFVLAPAQGFFVNSTNTAAVTFSKTNQATTGGAFQKTARTEIKLLMNTSTNERFAKIYLTDIATKGFDSGWEGEVFGGIANKVDVFTELVSDNQGKNYQVQSLPISEMESMVIPVGVIAEAGKELTFSLEQTNFPTDVKVYLEDRVANTYNELTNSKTFKVTLSEALNDVGRFYLHASKSSLSVDDNVVSENISMYKSNATTLKVVGLPNGTSNIKLFNILGKQVLNTSFIANGVKEITLPKLAIGVYIVQLETETSKLNKKIVIE
jgi:predicted outer membrane repeat protein